MSFRGACGAIKRDQRVDCRGETKINYWFLTETSGDRLGCDARHTISV
jgi:hypothetical protein